MFSFRLLFFHFLYFGSVFLGVFFNGAVHGMFFERKAFASLTNTPKWNQQVEEALQISVQQEVQKIVGGSVEVFVEELGLDMKSSCESVDRVEIEYPIREDFRGPITVRAVLFQGETICQKLRFQSRIRIIVDLPVAKNSVMALEEVDVIIASVRYDQLQGTPVYINSGPWIARTNIKKMEPLTQERVKLKPLNYEGDQVSIVVKKKGLEILTQGKLMSDAYINSRVRVFVFATSVVLDGILIKKDRVEIIGANP